MQFGDHISWEALEYEDRPKSPDWFWALGIIGICTVVASIIYGNFLFAVFIVVAVSLLVVYSVRKPQIVTFEITERGVKVSHYTYDYKHIKSFAIVAKDRKPKLILETDRMFMPLVTLPLGNADWKRVQTSLLKKMKEREMDEPASHRIMDFLGF